MWVDKLNRGFSFGHFIQDNDLYLIPYRVIQGWIKWHTLLCQIKKDLCVFTVHFISDCTVETCSMEEMSDRIISVFSSKSNCRAIKPYNSKEKTVIYILPPQTTFDIQNWKLETFNSRDNEVLTGSSMKKLRPAPVLMATRVALPYRA